MTGCDSTDEEPVPSTDQAQQRTNIGISLGAPGLISGIDPAHVSGAEIDLAVALSQQLDIINSAEDVTWVPITGSQSATVSEADELDITVGQFTGASLDEDMAWVGPYLNVEAGLLVRSGSTAEDETSPDYLATKTIRSMDDLDDAAVCVVADSLADSAASPLEHHTTQQTVTACETGLRSGRYDAIAADDVQLAGLLESSATPEAYEIVGWSDMAADSDEERSDQFQTSGQYWIGTTPQHCDAAAAALQQVLTDGVVEEHLSQWNDDLDYTPDYVEADEVTTQHCNTKTS